MLIDALLLAPVTCRNNLCVSLTPCVEEEKCKRGYFLSTSNGGGGGEGGGGGGGGGGRGGGRGGG